MIFEVHKCVHGHWHCHFVARPEYAYGWIYSRRWFFFWRRTFGITNEVFALHRAFAQAAKHAQGLIDLRLRLFNEHLPVRILQVNGSQKRAIWANGVWL